MQRSTKALFVLFFLLALHLRYASAATNQFQHWFPEFGPIFERILHENCTEEYGKYVRGKKNSSDIDRFHGGGRTNALAQPVINCILSSTAEFVKAGMAAAGVLLGLAPSMLATLGSSTEETSMLFIFARRPLLALCLSTGSPAVFPMRSFEYRDPVGPLRERKDRLHPPKLPFRGKNAVVVVEYLVAIAAIVNIGSISRQLGLQVPCSFVPQITYMPLLWGFLGAGIHLLGAYALSLRARVISGRPYCSVLDWLRAEFVPMSKREPLVIYLTQETYPFLFTSWLTSILTVCHVIYGTLVFSSMLFISVKDSVYVISRFMMSVISCRIVLMYELASLRETFNVDADSRVEEGAELL